MKNYVQPGQIVPLLAPEAVSTGDGVLVGSLFGVGASDAASGTSVEVQLEGVFDLPKNTTVAFAQGDPVFWSTTDSNVTNSGLGDLEVGKAIVAANTSATAVRVRLDG